MHAMRGMLLLVMCLASITGASAAEINIGTYLQWTFIRIDGPVVQGDYQQFVQMLRQYRPTHRPYVILRSQGGRLIEGIEIGLTIHRNKLETVVVSDSECASVCAMIWLAGQPRTAHQGARIGFHAAHDGKGNTTGGGNAVAGAYLAQLGFSFTTIYYLTKTAPESMEYLTAEKAELYGIKYGFISREKEEQRQRDWQRRSTR